MSSSIAPLTEQPPWSTNASRPIPWLEAENYLHVKTNSRRRGGSLIRYHVARPSSEYQPKRRPRSSCAMQLSNRAEITVDLPWSSDESLPYIR
jgi:hypothetical protein